MAEYARRRAGHLGSQEKALTIQAETMQSIERKLPHLSTREKNF